MATGREDRFDDLGMELPEPRLAAQAFSRSVDGQGVSGSGETPEQTMGPPNSMASRAATWWLPHRSSASRSAAAFTLSSRIAR